jgi:hypothetical protein
VSSASEPSPRHHQLTCRLGCCRGCCRRRPDGAAPRRRSLRRCPAATSSRRRHDDGSGDGAPQNTPGLLFLTVGKVAFIGGVRIGTGLVISRLPDGSWSAPCAVGTLGVTFGAVIGAEISDMVTSIDRAQIDKRVVLRCSPLFFFSFAFLRCSSLLYPEHAKNSAGRHVKRRRRVRFVVVLRCSASLFVAETAGCGAVSAHRRHFVRRRPSPPRPPVPFPSPSLSSCPRRRYGGAIVCTGHDIAR